MNRKLFVGSLSWHTTDQTLAGHFRDFGEVEEARVITDRDTGQSRGFGFVTLDTEEAAQVAMEALDGSRLDGREIVVNEAKERRSDRPERTMRTDRPGRNDRSHGEVEIVRRRRDPNGGHRMPRRVPWKG